MKNWKISIEEIHHVHKKDKPSGTAKSLANSLNYYGEITSIREGEDFGTHKIKLENDNEVMEFYHKAKSRNIFASGCLRFIDWIRSQQNGLYYGMEYKDIDYYEKWSACGNRFGIVDYKHFDSSKINEYSKILNVDGIISYKIVNKENCDFIWNYYNRDGSCVEMCGNGARCVAKCLSTKINKNELNFINNFGISMNAIINSMNVSVKMPIVV